MQYFTAWPACDCTKYVLCVWQGGFLIHMPAHWQCLVWLNSQFCFSGCLKKLFKEALHLRKGFRLTNALDEKVVTDCRASTILLSNYTCLLISCEFLVLHVSHSLHLDAQYGQMWHLSTQLHSEERTGRRLLWSTTLLLLFLLSDSQVSISLVIHGLWWTVFSQVKAHVVLTCTNGVSPNHLPVIVASDRPWTTLSTRAH